jgi:Fic family protein
MLSLNNKTHILGCYMNINELHPKLRKTYKENSECGICKSKDSKLPNLYFVVPPLPPSKIGEGFSFKKISEAMTALNKLTSFSEMDDLDKLINYLFVRREAVQSSRLEGTWSTIDEVLSPDISENVLNDATLSVRGYAHSIESLFEEASKKKESIFNLKNILKIHKEMMSKDPNYLGIPGKIRTLGKPGSIVYIGGGNRPENSIYNPTPPEHVKESLEKIISWFSDTDITEKGDAGIGVTLPIRMAIGHSHFEAVHPFTDGNGRVGRALWPLQMIASGYMPLYLSGYVEKEKHSYSEALQAAQKKLDYSKIIDFISSAIVSCSIEMKLTKDKLISLPILWQTRGNFRKNSAAYNALSVILKMPIFTVENLRYELNCSSQAAAIAVKLLVDAKIINERTGNKRNRLFAAEEVIILLSRDHGNDIDVAMEKAFQILKNK